MKLALDGLCERKAGGFPLGHKAKTAELIVLQINKAETTDTNIALGRLPRSPGDLVLRENYSPLI
jgi:hypothetical protein